MDRREGFLLNKHNTLDIYPVYFVNVLFNTTLATHFRLVSSASRLCAYT